MFICFRNVSSTDIYSIIIAFLLYIVKQREKVLHLVACHKTVLYLNVVCSCKLNIISKNYLWRLTPTGTYISSRLQMFLKIGALNRFSCEYCKTLRTVLYVEHLRWNHLFLNLFDSDESCNEGTAQNHFPLRISSVNVTESVRKLRIWLH